MTYTLWLLAGTFYGFIIGLIPVAGVMTALLTIYSFVDIFRSDPYTLVVFTTAIVVSCSIGDNFSSIMMNVPGAAGSAATMVDGFPMAQRGEGARALSAAVITSTINGFIWGVVVFVFLPYYGALVLRFGIPEQLTFVILAFTSVCFITNHYWVRGIASLALGIFVGLIGQDPGTGAERFTFGWQYLGHGIQVAPIMAGILALPELLELYFTKKEIVKFEINNYWEQVKQGAKDSFVYLKDGIRGGAVGAFIGLLPGVGGAIADWIAYSNTVALNKNETFGNGNIRGVIGCEGSNNAQKATGYIPTVLFGIPAAPFEVIILSLFTIVGIELGTPALLADTKFFDVLTYSYMAAMALTFVLSFVAIRYIGKIFELPINIWFWTLIALIVWSCVQYTGYIEDYLMLIFCTVLGLSLRYLKMSRAAFIIGFVLSNRIESLFTQYRLLFNWYDVILRPISLTLVLITIVAIVYGIFFNNAKVNYT
jgi:TctA family transporter